jgi:hypothetical protein
MTIAPVTQLLQRSTQQRSQQALSTALTTLATTRAAILSVFLAAGRSSHDRHRRYFFSGLRKQHDTN